MAGIHRKSYSLKIVTAAVAAVSSATLPASLHAQQSTVERVLGEVQVRTIQNAQQARRQGDRHSHRVQGFGPYARILGGLDYVSDGQGLLPRPNVTMWIEQRIKALKAGPFREPAGAGGQSQARARASSVAGASLKYQF